MQRHPNFIRIVLLAGIVGMGLAMAIWFTIGDRKMTMPFDRSAWRDVALIYEEPYLRLGMVGDLTKNHLSVGLSREQVVELLGEPTDTPHFRDHDLVYWLGDERGFIQVDSSWLVVDFDTGGKLSKFDVVTD